MNITIQSFGGINLAQLEVPKGISVLVGANGSGKSSILRALASCLNPSLTIPVCSPTGKEAIIKKHSKMLVNGNAGGCTVVVDQQQASMTWPKNKRTGVDTFGTWGVPSKLSLGLVNWMTLSFKEKSAIMASFAKKNPDMSNILTKQEFSEALQGHRITESRADYYWDVFEQKRDYDQLHRAVVADRSETVGLWKYYAGENYGSEKARDFKPAGWTREMENVHPGTIQETIAKLETDYQFALKNQAVGEHDIERLRGVAEQVMLDFSERETQLRLEDATINDSRRKLSFTLQNIDTSELDSIRQRIAEEVGIGAILSGELKQLKRNAQNMMICPSCSSDLSVDPVTSKLVVGQVTEEEHFKNISSLQSKLDLTHQTTETLKQSLRDLQEQEKKECSVLDLKVAELDQQQRRIHAELHSIENNARMKEQHIAAAKVQLAELEGKMPGSPGVVTAERVEHILQTLQKSKRTLVIYSTKKNADLSAECIRQLDVLKHVFSESGLRKQKMETILVRLNKELKFFSVELATWGLVTITEDYDLLYDGRPFVICSAAEQYRCLATFQAMVGMFEQTPVYLFDGADVLDSAGRQGLVRMMTAMNERNKLPEFVIIAMTGTKNYSDVISKSGSVAATFWIENGKAVPGEKNLTNQQAEERIAEVKIKLTALTVLRKFVDELSDLDWGYQMSDDPNVVREGQKKHKLLMCRAKEEGLMFMQAYNNKYVEAWKSFIPDCETNLPFPEAGL